MRNYCFPLPFIEDQRSFQTVLFVDAGNVFDTHCGELQENCSNVDLSRLSSSYGLGLSWLSGFGPLTFSVSRPIHKTKQIAPKCFNFPWAPVFNFYLFICFGSYLCVLQKMISLVALLFAAPYALAGKVAVLNIESAVLQNRSGQKSRESFASARRLRSLSSQSGIFKS